ncbi:MAG: hypothetical protein RXQ57_05650 [Caldivirga sp.]
MKTETAPSASATGLHLGISRKATGLPRLTSEMYSKCAIPLATTRSLPLSLLRNSPLTLSRWMLDPL